MRKAMVALGKLSQSACSCSKPSLPRKYLWYRSHGTSSHVPSTLEEMARASICAEEMAQPLDMKLEEWGQGSFAANEWDMDSSLQTETCELDELSKRLEDSDWQIREADGDLPIHIEERLTSMHKWVNVSVTAEMEEMERRVEELYQTTTSTAEKALMEEPTRVIARDRFDPLTLERFAMKLIECDILRALSVVYLLRKGKFGRATRETVDLLYSLGFAAKGQEYRTVGREIEGTSLRWYPKTLNERPHANIPASTWAGLPVRLSRSEGSYYKSPAKGGITVDAHPLQLKHGAFVKVSKLNYPIRRLQVFKGLEEGVHHVFGQKLMDPFCWKHMSTFIEAQHWPASRGPLDGEESLWLGTTNP